MRLQSVTAVALGFVAVRLQMGEKSHFTNQILHLLTCACVCFMSQNGKIDMTFFTHDCFHFTIKGHEELAKGLWNNMVKCLYLMAQEVKVQQSAR